MNKRREVTLSNLSGRLSKEILILKRVISSILSVCFLSAQVVPFSFANPSPTYLSRSSDEESRLISFDSVSTNTSTGTETGVGSETVSQFLQNSPAIESTRQTSQESPSYKSDSSAVVILPSQPASSPFVKKSVTPGSQPSTSSNAVQITRDDGGVSTITYSVPQDALSSIGEEYLVAMIDVAGQKFQEPGLMIAQAPSPQNSYEMKIYDVGEKQTAAFNNGTQSIVYAGPEATTSWQRQTVGSISQRPISPSGSQPQAKRDGLIQSYNIYYRNSPSEDWKLAASNVAADASGITTWKDSLNPDQAAKRFYKVEVSEVKTNYTSTLVKIGNRLAIALSGNFNQDAKVEVVDADGKSVIKPVLLTKDLKNYYID
ncbi:MAG: hypothetical protein EXS63_03905, partial [Candidatus Omnitrophica bacterium]|nr:hypothetical protein [Candidatus Omnitrophota bacterium]